MPVVDTQLVDTEIAYCDPDDVFQHIRNKDYTDLPQSRSGLSQGGLSQDDVDRLIDQSSERVDNFTKRAWRTRKVVDLELEVRFSHKQKHARHRRRRHKRTAQFGTRPSSRAFVELPHIHIKPIDSAQGDQVIILNEKSTNDITSKEGRDTGEYVISNRKGVLRPDVSQFVPISTTRAGRNLRNGSAAVRVTYRYGHPKDVTNYDSDGDGVSDEVPGDVREATGLLVAARLIRGDQYGNLVPNAGDDTPNLSDAATRFEESAMNTLRNYRRA